MDKSLWNRIKPQRKTARGKHGQTDSVANRGAACKREKPKKASIPLGYVDPGLSSGASMRRGIFRSPKSMHLLIVTKKAAQNGGKASPRGLLRAGSLILPCAIGSSGICHDKREGDGATPAGRWQLLDGFYRGDRIPRPRAWRLFQPLKRDMGWCDAPGSPSYNRPVKLPFSAGHENLWRDDALYDLVIVLGYNLYPRREGRGSAIFLHCARADFAPTAGCVALQPADLRRLLPLLSAKTTMIVR
jgi:L,D-peptidoglycan transpeptidase YkuD (ErfK/YbiS/YcfS/YnhG family)